VTPSRLRIFFFALAAAASATLAGCGGSVCLPNAVPGLQVTVLDGPGGPALCGVTVTATDGAYSEVLTPSLAGAVCAYFGASERPGVYNIAATFEGRTAMTSNVPVTTGGCHVIKNDITIELPAGVASRSPPAGE